MSHAQQCRGIFFKKELLLLLLFITREHDRYRSIIGQCFGQTGG